MTFNIKIKKTGKDELTCLTCNKTINYGISDEGLAWNVQCLCTSNEYARWISVPHKDLSVPKQFIT